MTLWGRQGGIFKSRPRILKVRIWLMRGWGRYWRWLCRYVHQKLSAHFDGGLRRRSTGRGGFLFENSRRRLVRILKLHRGFILTKMGDIKPQKLRGNRSGPLGGVFYVCFLFLNFKSCLTVPKLWIWVLSCWGRCLKVTLQTRKPKKFRTCRSSWNSIFGQVLHKWFCPGGSEILHGVLSHKKDLG